MNVTSSKLTLSPSAMAVFGKTRFAGHSSPKTADDLILDGIVGRNRVDHLLRA